MPEENNPPTLADIERADINLPVPTGLDYKHLYEELKVKFDAVTEDYSNTQIENAKLERLAKTHAILDRLIEPSAKASFRFMCAYSAVVGGLLLLSGFKPHGFNLPETVLNFLVGSTAVTVIGLVSMILTGIFVARPK